MKTYLLTGILFLLVLLACEKSNEPNQEKQEEEPLNYYPLTTGSYWVYDTYKIDSLGNETLKSENDTVAIIGDSLIRGNNYKVFYGKPYNLFNMKKIKYCRRDSSGYIVDGYGLVVFQNVNLNDTSYFYPSWAKGKYFYHYFMEKYSGNYTTFSTDSVISKNQTIYKVDNGIKELCTLEKVYAPGIGLVQDQNGWMSEIDYDRAYYEIRLKDYLIKE